MDERVLAAAPVDLRLAQRLSAELGVSRITGEILARRGFGDAAAARAFLHPDFKLHSPYLLPGVAEAAARIDRALKRGETIAVHGDYDADGVTATFLLTEVLRSLGGEVVWHLPNRFSEGYGLSARAVEALAEQGARLLVTVDCGVTAVAEVARARELGLDVVVTDHHEPKEELPDCVVVDPRLGGYPCPHLAGVGVALKLAHALLQQRGPDRVELPLSLRPYVDLVAVGTVADVVPLVDENRALVMMGLGRLRSAPRPGLAALLEVSGVAPADVESSTLGYRLGPRLNAAGRLDDASLAMELLGATDRQTALPLALKLNELNAARQDIEAAMAVEALAMVPDPPPPALVLSSPDWHEGVVGIVASRLVEQVNRPAILLSESDGEAAGSGRSIPGFDLLAAVTACSAPLLSFGGHRAACGLRLRRDDLPAFREAFTAYAGDHLAETDLARRTRIDAVACGDELTLAVADELELFAPHGLGNPQITLLLHAAEVHARGTTRNGRHLQSSVRCDQASCSAIHFDFADNGGQPVPEARYDIPLLLRKNAYGGMVSAQVQVKGLFRLDDEAHDLCPTACDLGCPERVSGDGFWRLLDELAADEATPFAPGGGREAEAEDRAAAAIDDPRVVDRRGRPVLSTLAALLTSGERLLVLVADVARRRPLLARDLSLAHLRATGLYLNASCLPRRLPLACGAAGESAPDVVMASTATAAAHPELVAAFSHVAFVDPPFSAAALHSVLAAAGETACVHALWGQNEVHFAGKVASGEYDLDAELRRVYRVLSQADGRPFDDGLERELAAHGRFLAKLPTLAVARATLLEAGLVVSEGGKNRVRKVDGKVDLTTSPTYRRWHRRHTSQYLQRCLTARI